MSIKIFSEFFSKKNEQGQEYTGSSKRGSAAMIDMWIVLFLRMIVMQTLGSLWINRQILSFMEEFKNHFGTETIKNTREHIDFIMSHSIFSSMLIFYAIVLFVGALYYALLNASSWQATIGKRIMKTMVVKSGTDSPITFARAISHYFLAILPFAYIFFLISYQVSHKMTLFQAVTASELNVFFGLMFMIWVQMHLFTKKKVTAYDVICGTIYLNGRTKAKFPWTKVSANSDA
jgi:uncharacterized RDD family membrane protein YckC